MREFLLRLRDRFMDSLFLDECQICEAVAVWSEARAWPSLRTTWGDEIRVCPRCYEERTRPFSAKQ